MNTNNNKRKISILITSVTLVIVLLIGITYAYFSSTASSNARTVQAGTLRIQYETDSVNSESIDNISPIYDSEITTKANKIAFNIRNNGTAKAFASISLTDIVMSSELSNLEFKWALYQGNTKISNGNLRNVTDGKQLLMNNLEINSGASASYAVYIWISESGLDQSNLMDKEFSCKITVEGSQNEQAKLLTSKIKEDNTPVTTTPNFANTSETDEGLIQGVDKDGQTYYFRGAVDDNYLKIQGLTWGDSNEFHNAGDDMLFRIVRINGSGTTRIMLNDRIGTSAFNTNYNNEKYVGYTYDNSAPNVQDGTSSTIKNYLDNETDGWYKTNMQAYDSIFASERYCNDTSVSSKSRNSIIYGAYGRLNTNNNHTPEPTFICPITEKTYGGEYDLKIGLLSADEAVFAGGKYGSSNTSYYMQKPYWWWVGSPYRFNGNFASEFYVTGSGYINSNNVNDVNNSAVPVFNLKSDILYSSGSGTKSDPYVISAS